MSGGPYLILIELIKILYAFECTEHIIRKIEQLTRKHCSTLKKTRPPETEWIN